MAVAKKNSEKKPTEKVDTIKNDVPEKATKTKKLTPDKPNKKGLLAKEITDSDAILKKEVNKPLEKVKEKPAPKEKAPKVPKVKKPPVEKVAKPKKIARPSAPPKPLIPKIEKIGTPIPLKPHKVREVIKPMGKVVIPKTTYKESVAYQPDFVKSVLDEQVAVPAQPLAPTLRYSDSDLVEFRELINRKLDAAKKELGYLQGLITRKDEMGGDNDDSRYMTMEDGSLSMEREQLSQMASRQITFVDHLEKATIRIENKTYGICRVTGKLIDKARLKAVPHATLSVEAKLGKVK